MKEVKKMFKIAMVLLLAFALTDCGWLNRFKKPGRRKHSIMQPVEKKADAAVTRKS